MTKPEKEKKQPKPRRQGTSLTTSKQYEKLLKEKVPGTHGDGGGLYLQISKSGSASWIFRYQLNGRRRDMGLGSALPDNMAATRTKADELRKAVASGIDPIDQREEQRAEEAQRRETAKTFEQYARERHAAWAANWTSPKTRDGWINSLVRYAFPVLGARPVQAVTVADTLAVLEPMWQTKPRLGELVRDRIRQVLDAATATGIRTGPNPADWAALQPVLRNKAKSLQAVRHHAAIPYKTTPQTWQQLCDMSGFGPLCLRFTILTCVRTAEARGAQWTEFDLDAKTWTIPAERMKVKRNSDGEEQPHTVPLSTQALEILATMRGHDPVFVFPGLKRGKPLGDSTLLAVMRRTGLDATVHGFRSSFRDWAAEETMHDAMACELALAHSVGSAVARAYHRGNMLEKRRALMQDWADFCGSDGTA